MRRWRSFSPSFLHNIPGGFTPGVLLIGIQVGPPGPGVPLVFAVLSLVIGFVRELPGLPVLHGGTFPAAWYAG
jgi:hypothetical protein